MKYRNGYSLLGYGCMRLPARFEEAEKLILHAIDSGINYYDTAYTYRGNEMLLGKILASNHCRDKVRIATKLPPYLVKTLDDAEKIFQTELLRLQTEFIDNYLLHMLPDVEVWNRLCGLGIVEWLEEKKASGQIRHVGFSFHGNTNTFLELLDVYPWEFCQIQYNYMDEHSQAGRAGLMAAYERGISVVIMEPLRGGNLTVGLPQKAKLIFAKTKQSPAQWGLGWLYAQGAVTCVLSGMNTMEMLDENIETAEKDHLVSDETEALFREVREAINSSKKIDCSGCSYCMPCPAGVDIPGAFRCYNVSYSDGYRKGFKEYLFCTTFKSSKTNASLCIKCGLCETKCPQSISIREDLAAVSKRFENPIYKLVTAATRNMYRGSR